MLGFPPLHGHLRFNFVNFFDGSGTIIRLGRHTALKERGSPTQVLPDHGLTLSHFAKHVKLAFPNKIVTPLALNHFLEQQLAHRLIAIRLFVVKLCPARCRIANELNHF